MWKSRTPVCGIARRVGLVAAVATAAVPSAAAAATVSDYHPDQSAREFRSNAGGWDNSTTSEGLCVQDVTCPTVTNSHQASGGTDGSADGHLRTEVENLAGADSTSRGIWRSPGFTYRGADGQTPSRVTFELARRTDLSPLLSTSGSAANYSVEIVEVGSAVGRTVIDTAPLGASEGWARTPEASIPVSALDIGGQYRIRIVSTFSSDAEAFPASHVDYDDVRLRAVLDDAAAGGTGGGTGGTGGGTGGGGGGGGGGNGGRGDGNGGNGAGGGGAVLNGNRLFLRLSCLGVQKQGRCKVRAVAYSSKNGARMTFPVERRVKAKKGKKVTLRIRPRFVKQLSSKDKVLVRSQVRAGDRRKTKYKRYELTERR